MNQSPLSHESTQTESTPTQMLAYHHQRANEFYQAEKYHLALKELKQALAYATTENNLEVIERNIKTISQALQEEENTQMEKNSHNPLESTENIDSPSEGFIYQNKLLLLTILVGILCFTPIIMKLIERFTHVPAQQEITQIPPKAGSETVAKTKSIPVSVEAPTAVMKATVLKSGVNLREQASIQSPSLARLALNEKVTVLEDRSQTAGGYTWSKVQTAAGQTGWVSAAFLQMDTIDNSTQLTETTSTAPTASGITESNPTEITSQAPTTETSVMASNLKKVNSAGVNLRSGPSLTQSLITTLPAGTEIEVLQNASVTADRLTWSQVKTIQGTIGWIASKYIQP